MKIINETTLTLKVVNGKNLEVFANDLLINTIHLDDENAQFNVSKLQADILNLLVQNKPTEKTVLDIETTDLLWFVIRNIESGFYQTGGAK